MNKFIFIIRLQVTALMVLCFSIHQASAIEPDIPGVEYRNKVYAPHIHSVRMLLGDWEVSYPVMELHSDVGLVFGFDDLDAGMKYYYYTIIHCNSNWTPSDLQYFEYATGFAENAVEDISSSRNTLIPYTHYSIEIPNNYVQLNYSGNYLLVVYTDDGEKKPIVTQRFMLYENKIPIDAAVYQPTGSEYNTGQKIGLVLNRRNYPLFDPTSELNVTIMQNNQWDSRLDNLQPTFMNASELVYDYEDKQMFKGLNEYRYFSVRNLKILSERVQSIDFKNPYYVVTLFPESTAYFEKYTSREDVNGHYVIKSDLHSVIDENTDVDYVLLRFILESNKLPDNQKVYVFGALSQWEFSENCCIKYNPEIKAYELLLMLKQGYYNYRYVIRENELSDAVFFEASHWQTENDYQIFVYHNDISARYQRLVGYRKINSRNR
ncbi:MAG TPA: DUF5103 domain-containing protein [Bacteroidales bacterium]|nr:DUF5103 domain-containing protein [Bacteroidales bacterium]